MGHQQVIDHMFLDGLEDAYDKGRLMGSFAEDCASKFGFTREAQDRFAITSLERARKQTRTVHSPGRPVPIAIKAGKDERFIEHDEAPFKANFDKIPLLKPAFRKDGTVTAANSSSISDGAAALVMMRRSSAEKLHLQAACNRGRPFDPRAGAGTFYHCAGWRDSKAVRQDRLDRRQGGSLRDQ
jgi:acetyl-CoA C-acetyltransferase